MSFLIRLYRVFTGKKVSSCRLLLYVFLGYALSERFTPVLYIFDAALVFGGVLFASLSNDYYDSLCLGEHNEASRLLKGGKISRHRLLLFVWSPLSLSLFCFIMLLFLNVGWLPLAFLWFSFLLSVAYSCPPFRLKDRKLWGVAAPPVGLFCLFFQAVILSGHPSGKILMISALVFVYTWYLDFLHLADDSLAAHETRKMDLPFILNTLPMLAFAGVFASAVFACWHPIILVSLLAWLLRYIAIRGISVEEVAACRKSVFSRIYRIEEFMIYAILGLFNMFKG